MAGETNTVVAKRPQKRIIASVAASVICDAAGVVEVVTQYEVPLDLDSRVLAALRAATLELAARLQSDIRWVEEKEREELFPNPPQPLGNCLMR
jgi:predicted regulator of Ras-like GTPase activity (Roadblock/LC7/MglB family)